MNPSFLAELRRIVGDTHVLDDALELLTYECDALPHLREQPAAVALPGSAAEVQAIVRLCARDGVPFVARGHGTGLSGGALPVAGGLVIALSLIPHDMQYGPQAAMIAESFTGRLRYSGASLGYQLASVIAGGPEPYIATFTWGTTKNPYLISVYILFCCVVGFVATVMLKDRSALDHTQEYETQAVAEPSSVTRRAMG